MDGSFGYISPTTSNQVDDILNQLLPMVPEDPVWTPAPDLDALSADMTPIMDMQPWSPSADTGTESEMAAPSPGSLELVLPSSIPASPMVDNASFLITNWFKQVCPVWSAYDSGSNLNRKLALELWQDSKAVFYSMQGMCAAFLSTRLPHMDRPALEMMQRATDMIQAEAQAFKSLPRVDKIPSGLLYSLFGVGTTVCWIDARQLGLPFLKEAKIILGRLNREFTPANKEEADLLSFFNKNLTYCETLLTCAGNDDLAPDARPARGMLPDRETMSSTEVVLHPWACASVVPFQLFAQSVRLCRKFRSNMRRTTNTEKSLEMALKDIQLARKLEEKLLEMDSELSSHRLDTGDKRTTPQHLARVSEAYQLSSLLQLYQTFPDLVSTRLPQESVPQGSVPWENWITPLSLRLIKVLEQLPSDSGTRMVQPLLCITAATGLRYDVSTMMEGYLPSSTENLTSTPYFCDTQSLSEVAMRRGGQESSPPSFISQASIEVSEARHFIMSRMARLEHSLAPRPVVMARTLIQSIWDRYDSEIPGVTTVHWVDVMEDNDLRSMFG